MFNVIQGQDRKTRRKLIQIVIVNMVSIKTIDHKTIWRYGATEIDIISYFFIIFAHKHKQRQWSPTGAVPN